MKKKKLIFCIIVLLTTSTVSLGQWQADMVMSTTLAPGDQYKVYSDLVQYRYEFNQDGMNGVVITNPSTNVTAIILVDEKKVHYTKTDGMMSSMNDPVQAYNSTKIYGEEKILGEENISGYDCIKKAIYIDEKEIYTQWFSEELNFPVKMVQNLGEESGFVQLENIEDWAVDPSLFEVPDDYIEVDENQNPVIPEPPPPDKWERLDVAIPVDIQLSRGTEVMVNADEILYYKTIYNNIGDTPAKFSYHSFKNGEELTDAIQGPLDYRTIRLYKGEKHQMTLNWQEGQSILIKVYEGDLSLQIHKK